MSMKQNLVKIAAAVVVVSAEAAMAAATVVTAALLATNLSLASSGDSLTESLRYEYSSGGLFNG